MMLGQKKQNPDPPKSKDDGTATPFVTSPSIPPLRTFRLRSYSALNADGYVERLVEAHGLGIDESRMLSFVVFFFVDGDPSKPAQAQKMVLNAEGWVEVEEINPAFPVMETH